MSGARDPFLELDLHGVRSIEASAGTGKTFTLATLVVRLVLERALPVEKILAVTFTEAATQELRARVRRRLVLAADVTAGVVPGTGSADAELTARLLQAHLARSGEDAAAVARRLRAAADGIDQAAVFTIHGFCARVLREHALESGQGFEPPELLANDQGLREAVAADLWRAHATDAATAADLEELWRGGPKALAADLPALARQPRLRPQPPDPAQPDPQPRLEAAARALLEAGLAHGDELREALLAAVAGKVLNNNSYRAAWIGELFDQLRRWCQAGRPEVPFHHDKLGQLQRATLLKCTSKAGAGKTPDSPLCDAVQAYAEAMEAVEAWREARRVALLHRLRTDARRRLATLKRQLRVQTYDDLIDGVAAALDGAHGEALARRLREQYAIALVDEFQDTDPRQWRIFDRVFGAASGEPALFLIGDPKQAIYRFRGGDVETYLAACATAEAAPALDRNFRSRPSVLAAIEALYAQAGAAAFADPRIAFHPVQPGGRRGDGDFLRDGSPAPALTVWQAPPPPVDAKGKRKPWPAGRSRELATDACVAAIHAVLSDARAGRASIDGRPVRPGDIAVLVRKHREATQIRQALAAVGIPAVAAGSQSLFETGEALEVLVLLQALLHGDDDARLRAALATVLVGQDAHHVAALDGDGEAMRQWRHAALGWRERLDQGGPLALLGELCAAQATRLLALVDGERRLTNYLQLAEQLQEAQRQALGLHGLVDWLERAIAQASSNDETQLLRLESDAHRVQIVTLHKSKGLEYPLVFLPFVGIGARPDTPSRCVVVHDAEGPLLQWRLQEQASGWGDAVARHQEACRAEDARLLYVGLTRARDALWLASGEFYNHHATPLWPMLRDPQVLAAALPGSIVLDATPPPASLPWLPAEAEGEVPPARTPGRSLASDWWVYSFTQLARADGAGDTSSAATQPPPGGRDEPAAPEAEAPADEGHDPRFAGSRFGVVLHEVLEYADFAAWRDWRPGDPAPPGEEARIVRALRNAGYAEAELDDGIALLASLAGHTLTVPLPEGVRLAELPEAQRRAEIEFQFALAPTRSEQLLALLHRHGLLRGRSGFGGRRTLEGLMTGLIDLTYLHDGRWYVLDYKSNRLRGYGPAQMAEAMEHSEYPLQALIYTVALHRWLRFRLGGAYDYACDFGGVRYLFCRGLDAAAAAPDGSRPGVQAWRFEPALVEAVDALFAGREPAGAAA
ncbi:exodeoxyribonuclease V subunit beta [Pseudoxanthomonas sp. SGD-10]|nr:exodeoxyribonuclease V subunit beta [Pseudoxanthomonas sp. SGD-10]